MNNPLFHNQGSMVFVECQDKIWYGELVSYNFKDPRKPGPTFRHIILKDRNGKIFNVPQKKSDEATIFYREVLIEKYKKPKVVTWPMP